MMRERAIRRLERVPIRKNPKAQYAMTVMVVPWAIIALLEFVMPAQLRCVCPSMNATTQAYVIRPRECARTRPNPTEPFARPGNASRAFALRLRRAAPAVPVLAAMAAQEVMVRPEELEAPCLAEWVEWAKRAPPAREAALLWFLPKKAAVGVESARHLSVDMPGLVWA